MQTFSLICWAGFVAFGFGGWGIVGNYTGISPAWVGSITMISGGIVVPLLFSKHLISQSVPGQRAFLIMLAMAIINAASVYVFATKLDMLRLAVSGMTAGVFCAVVNIMMCVVALLLDFVLNGKSLSVSQMASIGTAVLTIFLASRS